MTPPVVSVVIPTYNHANFLKAAIESVLNQTFSDWETVVVNNYSEDDTVEVVSSFKDPRIHLINFNNYGVIAASRNKGIGLSKGKFIAFLDSDDTWYPQKLDHCLNLLQSGWNAVCHGEFWIKNGVVLRKAFYGPQSRTTYPSLLFEGNCLSTSAIIVEKSSVERVGGFSEDPSMVTAEDYALWLSLAKSGCRFAILDEILGEYRIHGGNQSKGITRNLLAELSVLEKSFSNITSQNLKTRLKMNRRIALAYYRGAREMQTEGNYFGSLGLIFKSWLKFPFLLRQYIAAGLGFIGWLKHRE